MTMIPGFWDVGPHDTLHVETTWREFVATAGGEVVEDLIPEPRSFENADFIFAESGVIGELKEVQTEFSSSSAFYSGYDTLMGRLVTEDPSWRPVLFGGNGKFPEWFYKEFVRLFRPPISRILKKANRQIRETKKHFSVKTPTGVIFFVNDGFTGLVRGLAASLLIDSYSSVDCLVYLTVNRYVEWPGSNVPRLLWAPTYSDRAADSLVDFIDDLGRKWFDYLERVIGPFEQRDEGPSDKISLRGVKSLVVPGDGRG